MSTMVNKRAQDLKKGDKIVFSEDGSKFVVITDISRNGVAGVLFPVFTGTKWDGGIMTVDTGSTPILQDNIYHVIEAGPVEPPKKRTNIVTKAAAKKKNAVAAAKKKK